MSSSPITNKLIYYKENDIYAPWNKNIYRSCNFSKDFKYISFSTNSKFSNNLSKIYFDQFNNIMKIFYNLKEMRT